MFYVPISISTIAQSEIKTIIRNCATATSAAENKNKGKVSCFYCCRCDCFTVYFYVIMIGLVLLSTDTAWNHDQVKK